MTSWEKRIVRVCIPVRINIGGLLAAAVLLIFPSAGFADDLTCRHTDLLHGQLYTPWMEKTGSLVVLRRELDSRGFDKLSIDEWRISEAGNWGVHATHRVLFEEREWYRERGELEMYARDLSAYIRARREALLQEGWRDASVLSLSETEAAHNLSDKRDSGLTRIVHDGVVFIVKRKREGDSTHFYLSRPSSGKRARLAHVSDVRTELGGEVSTLSSVGRIGNAWLLVGGRWLIMRLDLAPSHHAALRPGNCLTMIDMQKVLSQLTAKEADEPKEDNR